jgi:acetyl-CoA carboxylase alpha subunit
MTCYFRHLKNQFQKAGITATSENRKEIDRIIRNIVGGHHTNCASTWKEVKKRLEENEADFISQLSNAWKNRKPKP